MEDDPELLEALEALLEDAGHRVRMCRTVAEAIEAVRVRRPDVILTDLALAEESGIDLGRQLREQPDTSSIARIAMTGRVDPDGETVRHFDLYLRKPLMHDQLLRLLQQLASAVEDIHR